MLLTSEGSGQNSFSNITGNIREVGILLGNNERERNIVGGRGRKGEGEREWGRGGEGGRDRERWLNTLLSTQLFLLSYRLEYGFASLSPQLLLKCRLIRVAAHAMSLLLAVHLDYDTERR